MAERKSKIPFILTPIIAVLTITAAAGGLFIDGLYQGNLLLRSGWRGNDLITLTVASPLLIGSFILALRGSARGTLVWLGMLAYVLYNFAYYLFGAAFNSFFLIYVVLIDLAMIALIFALARTDVGRWAEAFRERTPARWIAGFMMVTALALTALYTVWSLEFVSTGEVPEIVTNTGHLTSIVFALDLTLVVPWFILGAIWLWQRKTWGYVIATIVNVKGAVYMLALTFVTLSAARAGAVESAAEAMPWVVIGVGSLVASVFLLVNVRKPSVRRMRGGEGGASA